LTKLLTNFIVLWSDIFFFVLSSDTCNLYSSTFTTQFKGQFTYTMPFPCRSPATTLPLPCHYPATTLPLHCHSQTVLSFVKVPYLVHEVILLSPFRNYLLLNCYHNLYAVNYTSTHVFAPNNTLLLVHHKRCFVSHWLPAFEIGMLLITNSLKLRVVAVRG
jgi:hypothetical protein